MNQSIIYGQLTNAYAYENITVSSTAIGPTASKKTPATGSRANKIFVSCETNPVRFCYDGTTPTTTVGHLMAKDTSIIIEGIENISNLLFIATGSNASIHITYEHFANKQ